MKKLFMISALLVFCLGAGSAEDNKNKYSVSVDNLRVREKPAIDSKILKVLNKGDTIVAIDTTKQAETISGKSAKWIKILFGCGEYGWVYGAYIGPYKDSSEYIFAKAVKLEESKPEEAISLYKLIIAQYPESKLDFACHGDYPYDKMAETRISISTCLIGKDRKMYHFSSFESALGVIIKSIKNNDKKFLIEHSPCELLVRRPADGSYEFIESAVAGMNLQDIDLSRYKKYEHHIIYGSKQSKEGAYMFVFENTKSGWVWKCFEEMDNGLMFIE